MNKLMDRLAAGGIDGDDALKIAKSAIDIELAGVCSANTVVDAFVSMYAQSGPKKYVSAHDFKHMLEVPEDE